MDGNQVALPLLYAELADWFHLLTAPEDYAAEAAFYGRTLVDAATIPVREILELGSGGGNNASHLKRQFQVTLVDVSAAMLRISRRLNPECEHVVGDMRSIRLGRSFDAIFVHDAVSYITTLADLRRTIETAYAHCKPGGAVLLCPDFVKETFRPSTRHGGHDEAGRGLRYLSWTRDPDPEDETYISDMAYMLREGETVRCESDRHILGLFRESEWLRVLRETGFAAQKISHRWPDLQSDVETIAFIGVKRAG